MATKPNVCYTLKPDENIERALRGFKRLCEKAGIKKAVRAKRYYEKPSDQRRRDLRRRIRNQRRALRKRMDRMHRKLNKARSRQKARVSAFAGGVDANKAAAPAQAPAGTAAVAETAEAKQA